MVASLLAPLTLIIVLLTDIAVPASPELIANVGNSNDETGCKIIPMTVITNKNIRNIEGNNIFSLTSCPTMLDPTLLNLPAELILKTLI